MRSVPEPRQMGLLCRHTQSDGRSASVWFSRELIGQTSGSLHPSMSRSTLEHHSSSSAASRPSEEDLGPALMMRLLLDLPSEHGYFRPLAHHPTMAQSLWTTVYELRMAGVHPENLKPEVFSSSDKHAELVALLSAYEHFLAQHQRGDIAIVYNEALKHPDWCPIKSSGLLDRASRYQLESAPAVAYRFDVRRTFPSACIRAFRRCVPRRLMSQRTERLVADVATNELAFLMSPACCAGPDFIEGEDQVIPCRRPRSGNRRSFPPDSRYRCSSRSSRNRLRIGRSRGTNLGEGTASQLAGDVWGQVFLPSLHVRVER